MSIPKWGSLVKLPCKEGMPGRHFHKTRAALQNFDILEPTHVTFPYNEVLFQQIHVRSFHVKRHAYERFHIIRQPQSFYLTRFTQMISS